MYDMTRWQDHVTEFEDRYTETDNGDGTITHVPVEGDVIQEGTPQNARNFNNMETGIFGSQELAAFLALQVKYQRDALKNLAQEVGTITLTNTQDYPFNNSVKTIPLTRPRDTVGYTVLVESTTDDLSGGIGDVLVTAKLVNGFKVQYTGAAKQVTIKYIVSGGMN